MTHSSLHRTLAVALAMTGLAVPAQAQFARVAPSDWTICWRPTLEQCQDADWYETDCGERHVRQMRRDPDATCNVLLADDAAARLAELDTETVEVPETRRADGSTVEGGGEVEAHIEPTARSGRSFSGLSGRYAAQPMALMAHSANDDHSAAWPLFFEALKRNAWANNDVAVETCEEYVYEKYYDYALFEDGIAPLDDDFRGIFEVAYGLRGERRSIGTRGRLGEPMRGLDGRELPPAVRWPGVRVPKNTFFGTPLADEREIELILPDLPGLAPLEGPNPFTGVVLDDQSLIDLIRPRQRYYTPSWRWHDDMDRWTGWRGYSDETMNRLDRLKEDFAKLLTERERLVRAVRDDLDRTLADVHADGFQGCPPEPFGCDGQAREALDRLTVARDRAYGRLAAMDARIEEALQQARGEGCLSTSFAAACDWSPRLFARQVTERLTAEREADFERCVHYTGDDFANARRAFVDPDTQRPIYGHRDYTRSGRDLELFFARFEAWLDRVHDVVGDLYDAETGTARLAGAESDEVRLGSGQFGLELSYDLSWELFGLDRLLCNLHAELDASFSASGTVFGEPTGELIDAQASATAEHVHAHLRVMGQDVFMPIDQDVLEFGDFNIVSDDWSARREEEVASARFSILGIPMKVAFSVAGAVGLELSATGNFDRGGRARRYNADRRVWETVCSDVRVSLNGRARPYAQVDAIGRVSVDAVIAEAGVKGVLTLVDASLPLDVDLGVRAPGGDLFDLEFTVDSTLDLTLRMLDGRISLFARLLAAEAERTIFSWNGIERSWNAFTHSYSVPLSAVLMLLDG